MFLSEKKKLWAGDGPAKSTLRSALQAGPLADAIELILEEASEELASGDSVPGDIALRRSMKLEGIRDAFRRLENMTRRVEPGKEVTVPDAFEHIDEEYLKSSPAFRDVTA